MAKDPNEQDMPGTENDDADLELHFDWDNDEDFSQLVPQCMYCHSIRNAEGEWLKPEDAAGFSGPFSHGTCPNCEPKLYAQLGVDVPEK